MVYLSALKCVREKENNIIPTLFFFYYYIYVVYILINLTSLYLNRDPAPPHHHTTTREKTFSHITAPLLSSPLPFPCLALPCLASPRLAQHTKQSYIFDVIHQSLVPERVAPPVISLSSTLELRRIYMNLDKGERERGRIKEREVVREKRLKERKTVQ